MRQLAEGFAAKKPVSLDEVARKERISQGYLEEVARLLRSAGLIAGRRGAGGGYVLARNPSEITVAEVITAMEGKTWMMECLGEMKGEQPVAARSSLPAVRHANEPHVSANDAVWKKIQGQVMTTLHQTTIASLVNEKFLSKELRD